jgi:hypothetical protein
MPTVASDFDRTLLHSSSDSKQTFYFIYPISQVGAASNVRSGGWEKPTHCQCSLDHILCSYIFEG